MNTKPTASNRTKLARRYGVHYNTFLNWLKEVPELRLTHDQRTLTPKQVSLIYEHLGEP